MCLCLKGLNKFLTNMTVFIKTFLIFLLFSLAGCASPGVQCNLQDNYSTKIPLAWEGQVTIIWRYTAGPLNGSTLCFDTLNGRVCHIKLPFAPPTFNDVCALMMLGHEVGHAMGGDHE
jgi:hypothetical protein